MLRSYVFKMTFLAAAAAGMLGAGGPGGQAAVAGEPAASETEQFFGPQRDWPRYRGPTGNGVTTEKGLPVKWSKTENILWSVDIFQPTKPIVAVYPYSSPIVYKDKVFITLGNYKDSIFVSPYDPKKDPAAQVKDPKSKSAVLADMVEFKLVCFNKTDGRKLWEASIEPGNDRFPGVGDHNYEMSFDNSTPCTDGERVYVAFSGASSNEKQGSGVLAAVDYDGKVVWRQDLSKLIKGNLGYNLSTSPMIYKNLVVMVLNTTGEGATVAFDRKTGELKYREPRPATRVRAPGLPSPVGAFIKGAPFILNNCASLTIEGLNPENGKVVWFVNHGDGRAAQDLSSMALGGGIVYSDGPEGYALSLDTVAGAQGDVTKDVAWKKSFAKVGTESGASSSGLGGSPIIAGGYLYRGDSGETKHKIITLRCIEAATGKEMYAEDLGPCEPAPLSTYASPFATADGLIYFASSGKSTVIKAGPKFELVAVNDLGDGEFVSPLLHGYHAAVPNYSSNYSMSSAAVSDGKIYIQGCNKLWCIGK